MLTSHGRSLTKPKNLARYFINTPVRNISREDVIKRNPEIDLKLKYDINKNPEAFKKEYLLTHWLSKYTSAAQLWYQAPFRLRIWSTDKDTELGRFSWNSNGALNNTLAKIFSRNEKLQTKEMIEFFINNFDHRQTIDMCRAEEPPKVTPNSVFLYKDTTNSVVNRRGTERFALFMVLTMAWNFSTLFMYGFIAWYFQLLSKNLAVAQNLVVRMDLIPETEQLHIVKIGLWGFPRSIIVNIKDLVKIEKEEDTICN